MPKKLNKVIDENAVCKFLKDTPLFGCLSGEDIVRVAKKCKVMVFEKGDVIFYVGNPANWFYIVYEGFVDEFVEHMGGVFIVEKNKKKHEYLGEMGILTGKPYLDTAVAVSPLILIAVPKEIFLDIVWSNVCIVKYILIKLAKLLSYCEKKDIGNMYLNSSGRLAFTLDYLASYSLKENTVSITQSELADLTGVSRQTVSRIISKWKKENIISTERGCITIHDIEIILDIAAGKTSV